MRIVGESSTIMADDMDSSPSPTVEEEHFANEINYEGMYPKFINIQLFISLFNHSLVS